MKAFGDWNNHYRPNTLEDMALTNKRKALFNGWLSGQLPPNLMLAGGYGIGKTTIARILARECSVMCGDEWNEQFFSSSFSGTRNAADIKKIMDTVTSPCLYDTDGTYRPIYILDEFEKLPKGEQSHFLRLLDDATDCAGFILCVNELEKVIDPIQDRCFKLDFMFRAVDKSEYVSELVRIGEEILLNEGVQFDRQTLVALAEQFWFKPRTFINSLQGYSAGGVLLI